MMEGAIETLVFFEGVPLMKLNSLLQRSFAALLLIGSVGIADSAFALTPEEIAARLEIKQQTFGGLAYQRAAMIEAGQAEPLMNFSVRDSVFIDWVIPRHNVEAFEAELNLPNGFHLTPIRILEHERARYFLSLNFYEVIIGAPTLRAEWSVYVTKGDDPTPRFMVIEAQTDVEGFDPVLGMTPPAEFSYTRGQGEVHVKISAGETQFETSFSEPHACRANRRKAALQWAMANDFIYWTNGIFDKAYYNGSLTEATMTAVSPRSVDIIDGTRWAQFVRRRPKHVLLFDAPVQFAVDPWANLNDPTLGLDPAHHGMLTYVKATAFSGLAYFNAGEVMAGRQEALVDLTVEDAPPAVFYNFRIPRRKVKAFKEALSLPKGFHLAKMHALPGDKSEYMLSLNVYRATGVAAGLRAEWSVYVTTKENRHRPFFMVIGVATEGPSLDVVNLFTPAAERFSYTVDAGGVATTGITQGTLSFDASFPVPDMSACDQPIAYSWARSNDRIYFSNGVYDQGLYNGTVLEAKVAVVDPHEIDIQSATPWSEFMDSDPLEVLAFCGPQEYRIMPWFNLEEQ